MKSASHVRDNLALSLRVPLSADRIAAFSR
jgi:hypothetical protein